MKRVILMAALLGGVSFSSLAASNASHISAKPKVDKRNTHVSKKVVVEGCGWVSFSISCGDYDSNNNPIDFLGRTYACSSVDVFEAKYRLQEEHCY